MVRWQQPLPFVACKGRDVGFGKGTVGCALSYGKHPQIWRGSAYKYPLPLILISARPHAGIDVKLLLGRQTCYMQPWAGARKSSVGFLGTKGLCAWRWGATGAREEEEEVEESCRSVPRVNAAGRKALPRPTAATTSSFPVMILTSVFPLLR